MNAARFLAPLRHKIFWVDAACMLLFAFLATQSHEGLHLFHTFWPFGLGVYIGWVSFQVAKTPGVSLESGTRVWLLTLVTGLVIWFLRNMRMPHWSFFVVASFMSFILIVGWRLIYALVTKFKQK
ncbi:MAG: DUF3054 domain-containing protein [Corynebacterium sp.]|nr:DUF3054 domain-containing protein [Corynebacterium sp.]